MNRSYKVIWNASLNCFMAVAEYAKSHGKSSSSVVRSGASVSSNTTVGGMRLLRLSALSVGLVAAGMSASIAADGGFDNVTATNVTASGTLKGSQIATTGDVTAGGDVTATNIIATGTLKGAQITTTGALTAGSITTSGNVNAKQVTVQDNATLAANNKQVVTGGQLYTTNQNVTANTNKITTNTNKIATNTTTIANHEDRITNNTTKITENTTKITANLNSITDILGKLGVDTDTPATGAGVKYFRANSSLPDAEATGKDSVAIGPEAKAKKDKSTAVGTSAEADGSSAIALGDGAKVVSALDEDSEAAIAIGKNSESSGKASVAMGEKANASGNQTIAFGSEAKASGANTIALGSKAQAAQSDSVAIGNGAEALARESISIGLGAGVNTNPNIAGDHVQNIAIGVNAGKDVVGQVNNTLGYQAGQNVKGNDNVAFGTKAGNSIIGDDNISIGKNANNAVTANRSVSIGRDSKAGVEGIAIGFNSSAGDNGLALGNKATTTNAYGVALGQGANAVGKNVALGAGSVARDQDVSGLGKFTNSSFNGSAVSVGSSVAGSESTRRIVNVEDGANDTDAVNVRQLQSAFEQVSAGAIIDYDKLATEVGGNWSQQIADNKSKYISVNDGGVDKGNKDNSSASAVDSVAIGPDAATKLGTSDSVAIGHKALAEADSAVVLGHDIKGVGVNSTTIGNMKSEARDESSIAIGTKVLSRDENSIVIGRDSYTDRQGEDGPSVKNSIVIGTKSRSTAEEGIVLGFDSLVNAPKGIAQGHVARATAENAMAFGTNSAASGLNSQASGTGAAASGTSSQASGTSTKAYAERGVALGDGAISGKSNPVGTAEKDNNIDSTAIGTGALAQRNSSIATGTRAKATADFAQASGYEAEATAVNSIAQGTGAKASAENSIAQGNKAEASGKDAIAQGTGARALFSDSIAFGRDTVSSAANALAFGAGATAQNTKSIAIGAGAKAESNRSVALGDGAVTVGAVATSSATVNNLTYGGFAGIAPVATVSVGTETEKRTITNLAAGRISSTSTDAINGSQLHATNAVLGNVANTTKNILGGNAALAPDGRLSMSKVGGTNFDTVDGAIKYAAQGWNVQTNGIASSTTQVKPGETVNFVGGKNIKITNTGKNVTVATADDVNFNTVNVDETVTIGGDTANQTVINKGKVTTNNLTVKGETKLGDNFTVNNDNSVTYNGKEIANKGDGLSFKGNTGGIIAKTLGDDQPLTISGALAAGEASSGANLRVDSDGSNLNLVMAKDLTDLKTVTVDNTITIGSDKVNQTIINEGNVTTKDLTVNNTAQLGDTFKVTKNDVKYTGPITDGDHITNKTYVDSGRTVVKGGTNVAGVGVATDAATGQTTYTVNADGASVSGSDAVSVTKGTKRANNVTDYAVDLSQKAKDDIANANKGWNVSTNANPLSAENVAPGATVDFNNTDGNILIAQDGTNLEFKLNKELDLTADGSVKAGDSLLNNDGLTVNDGAGNITNVTATGTTVTDGTYTSTVGSTQIVAGGENSVTINGSAGTVNGLTNTTWDPENIVSGQAATEDQLKRSSNDLTTAGLNFAGNRGDVHKDLGDTLIIRGGMTDLSGKAASGKNIRTVVNKDGEIVIQMARDLTDLDSIIINNGGPIISSTGINMGGKKITKVAAGTEDDDAVNFGQLNKVSGDVSKGLNFTGDDTTTVINRQLGDTLNITGGNGNIGVVANGNKLEVKMAENIDLGNKGSVTMGDTVISNDGLTIAGGPNVTKDGIDAGDNKITGVAKGDISKDSTDAVNGSQLWEVKNDIDKNVAASKTEVTKGKNITVTETKGDDGQTIYEVATSDEVAFDKVDVGSVSIDKGNIDKDGNTIISGIGAGKADNDAVNVGQLKDVVAGANKGFNISVQGENESNVGNGGSVDFNNQDGNIKVEKTADSNDISFNLNPNLDLGEKGSVTTGNTKVDNSGVTTGNTSMSGNGITITNANPDSDAYNASKTVSVTEQGLNNGGNRITNVGPGVSGTDAVNVNQLKDFGYNLSNKIDNVADEANAGVSSAMAMASLPQAYIPGKSMITGGIASYNGQGAAAVGFSKLSDNGRWVLKMSGSADTEGNVGGAVGGGFHF